MFTPFESRVGQIVFQCMKKSHISTKELSEKFNVGTRTIRNDIDQLNIDLKDTAFLKKIRGKGYRLFINNTKEFNNILNQIYKRDNESDSIYKRIALTIDLLMDQSKTLEELSLEINISRTTLVNDLKKASVILEPYNLKIVGKQNSGMSLVGKEQAIRLFVIENIYHYIYDSHFLSTDINEFLLSVAGDYDFDQKSTELLIKSIVILIDRISKGYVIKDINEKFEMLIDINDFQIANDIKQKLEKFLSIEIPSTEVLFITLIVASRRSPVSTRSNVSSQMNLAIENVLGMINKKISDEMGIVLDNQKGLYNDLANHISFMLNRIICGIHTKNPLIKEIKEKHPLAYKMAEISGEMISKEFDVRVSKDDLGYMAFHFGAYLIRHDTKKNKFNKVAIVCGTGRGTAKLILVQLEKVLNSDAKFDFYSYLDATEFNLSAYDLVFTTIPLSVQLDTPIIKINEIFDEGALKRQIKEATYFNGTNEKKAGNFYLNYSLLNTLLDKDNIFHLSSKLSYEEIIKYMAKTLIYEQEVDKDFLIRLGKREKKSTMVYDHLIAFPHTVHYQSNNIVLSIGIIDSPIKLTNEKKVQLIFMLGLPETKEFDRSLLLAIYDELLKLSNDKRKIKRIINTQSHEEVRVVLDDL